MRKICISCILVFMSVTNFAADFEVPTVSRCLTDLADSNTQDPKVYNIYSDFYYEYADKRDYAIESINHLVKEFAEKESSCASFTQPLNRETVKCHKVAGSDVCTVPSDSGEFIIVKDYVDSTNVVLVEYSKSYKKYPKVYSNNDFANLWLPQPDLCYEDLLKPIYDSQAHNFDSSAFNNFGDLRFLLARSNRDLVNNLSITSQSCSYQTFNVPTSDMKCVERKNKSTICGVSSTNGGYFVYVTDANFNVHMIFNRWD